MIIELSDGKLYTKKMFDQETGKAYLIHVHTHTAKSGKLIGHHRAELYITDENPNHGVLVNFANLSYEPDGFVGVEATKELNQTISQNLPEAIKRFEAIMAQGIKGNELQ